jgi:hypothetical protein
VNAIPSRFAAQAVISPCGLYRYTLDRSWSGAPRGVVNWIMLNPSTADANTDDPTIRRVIAFTWSWGYCDLVVTNLFALRSTDPDRLRRALDPIGPENDRHILEAAMQAQLVVCAWGAHGSYLGRDKAVLAMLRGRGIKPHALKLTLAGRPVHPLYLPSHLKPKPLEAQP